MIVPTVGRVVHYYPAEHEASGFRYEHAMTRYSDQPFVAHVVHVWSETCVNLVVYDHAGKSHIRTSVPINMPAGEGSRAEWMPYQMGQAAKTEAAEAKIAKGEARLGA
jgi:hypothetical protein